MVIARAGGMGVAVAVVLAVVVVAMAVVMVVVVVLEEAVVVGEGGVAWSMWNLWRGECEFLSMPSPMHSLAFVRGTNAFGNEEGG